MIYWLLLIFNLNTCGVTWHKRTRRLSTLCKMQLCINSEKCYVHYLNSESYPRNINRFLASENSSLAGTLDVCSISLTIVYRGPSANRSLSRPWYRTGRIADFHRSSPCFLFPRIVNMNRVMVDRRTMAGRVIHSHSTET